MFLAVSNDIRRKQKITYFDLFEFLRENGPLSPQNIAPRHFYFSILVI